MFRKKMTFGIAVLLSLLSSCANIEITNDNKASKDKETTLNVSNEDSEVSSIASEPWFRDGVHLITNPSNRVRSIVKGDGTILLTTYEPDIENIGKVMDIEAGVTNYIYKNYTGENYIKENIGYGEEEYIDARPTQRCIVYDKNGKEIGLTADTYAPSFSSINKIIYTTSNMGYADGGYIAFDVNTKEKEKLNCDLVNVMNGRFLLSTSPWDERVEKEEISICDGNLDIIKKIEGYSLDGVSKVEGKEYANLRKKTKVGDEYRYKVNLLDAEFNVIFDNDVDEIIWKENSKEASLVTGNEVIDYDFLNKTYIGEKREYKKESEFANKEKEAEYAKMEQKIYDENTIDGKHKYSYVSFFTNNEKVIYLAYLESNLGMFDVNKVDVYDENGKKVAEFDNLINQYSKLGYLFVNHDTLYDINLNIVGRLKEKRNLEMEEKFGKSFFYDRSDTKYNFVKPFTLYNDKLEPVLENLECIEMYSFADYLLIVDDEGTKLLDKDMNVALKFDRKIDPKIWYDNKKSYKLFEDLDTGRMGIIDKDFNIIVDKIKYIENMEDDYFTYQNGFEYGLMDYEGKPIIKFSIFDNMMEDSIQEDFKGDYVIKYDDNY